MDTTSADPPGLGATQAQFARLFHILAYSPMTARILLCRLRIAVSSYGARRLALSWLLLLLTVSLALTACGGGGGGSAAPATYSVTANVSGLTGSGLVLTLGNGTNINVGGNGQVTLASGLANGASYSVAVASLPVNPSETCTVTSGSGSVSQSNVSVSVSCTTQGTVQTSSNITLDSTLAKASVGAITQILSPSGTAAVGGWVPIDLSGSSGQSIALGVDANGNIIAASIVGSNQTTLTADSTAHAFVRLAIGDVPPTTSYAKLDAAIDSAAHYPDLVAAITAALVAGTPPATDPTVQEALAAVAAPVASATEMTVSRAKIKSILQPTANSLMPFTIIADTVQGVFPVSICGNPGTSGEVPICNSMPIPWAASSIDHNETALAPSADCIAGDKTTFCLLPGRTLLSASTTQVSSDPLGFSLTVAQNTNTHLKIISDVASGVIKTLLPYFSSSDCSAEKWDAAADLVVAAFNDGSWDELMEELVKGMENSQLQEICPKQNASGILKSVIGFYESVDKATAIAHYGLATYFEGIYAVNYWSKSQDVGVCLDQKGNVINCAGSYVFAPPALLVMAPGATTAAPAITALDLAKKPTSVPSGLTYSLDDPTATSACWVASQPAITVDATTGSVAANEPLLFCGGPYTITATDQQLEATGSFRASVVIPKISPSAATVYIGQGPSSNLTLTLTAPDGTDVTLPSVCWVSSDVDSVSLTASGVGNTGTSLWAAPAGSVPGSVIITASGLGSGGPCTTGGVSGGGSSGTPWSQITVNVVQSVSVPTVTLAADPTSVTSGNSSTLTWSSTNATSCTATGGWTSSTATSGTASTGSLTATTTYTMTCSDANGDISAPSSVTVTVAAGATVVTATFTYDGTAQGTSDSFEMGSGSFVYDVATGTLTSFNATINLPAGPATFVYGTADVHNFSFNPTTLALQLAAGPVPATTASGAYPQYFYVCSGGGASPFTLNDTCGSTGSSEGIDATQDFSDVGIESGPVVVTITSSK
jgi:hypothetical protein